MFLEIHQRLSDSPYIERIWRCHSNGGGQMTSVASPTWDMCFWEHAGQVHATVHGPETKVTCMPVPEGAELLGITFALGSAMPHLELPRLVDRALDIPDVTAGSFHLAWSNWRMPDNRAHPGSGPPDRARSAGGHAPARPGERRRRGALPRVLRRATSDAFA